MSIPRFAKLVQELRFPIPRRRSLDAPNRNGRKRLRFGGFHGSAPSAGVQAARPPLVLAAAFDDNVLSV